MTTVNYSTCYWQNDRVRLRAMRSSDWEQRHLERFDSAARLFLQNEIVAFGIDHLAPAQG